MPPRALDSARPAARPEGIADRLSAAESPRAEEPQDRESVAEHVEAAAARIEILNQSLTFRVHEDSGELMVQVVDRNSGKVLRETPPEEFLDLAVRLHQMVGLFLDETR